jgi:DNA-binding FrmR family transcriptional regulator
MEAQIDEQMVQELQARLARIEGQIRGVSKMVQEHRPCDQILMQVMAARAALEKVAGAVVTYGIEECFSLPPEQAREAIRHSVSLLTKV